MSTQILNVSTLSPIPTTARHPLQLTAILNFFSTSTQIYSSHHQQPGAL